LPVAADEASAWAHLPLHVLAIGGAMFAIGLGIFRTRVIPTAEIPVVASA